jgi:hypothetical protein
MLASWREIKRGEAKRDGDWVSWQEAAELMASDVGKMAAF